MTIPVTGVSELVLEASNLEAAERFYAGALGLPVVERWPERDAIWLMAGERTRIGLWRPQLGVAGGRGGAHVHFALHLPEGEFDAALARLRGLGLEPQVEERRRWRRRRSRSLYVDDPDGNCVELWTQDVGHYLRRAMRAPDHFDRTARKWDASYEEDTVRGHRWRARLAAVLESVGEGPGTLLEIGAGTGRLLSALAEGGWTVAAVDAAPSMVAFSRERVPSAAERITVNRAEALPYADDSFDVVVGVGVLEYTDIEAAVRELARVLRPGGRAVLGLHNGRAPASTWRRRVMHPLARVVKRIVPVGAPVGELRRPPLSRAGTRRLLSRAGLEVERFENAGCAVLLDPLDRLAPSLAHSAARAAEPSRLLRRALGTERLVVARKSPAAGGEAPQPSADGGLTQDQEGPGREVARVQAT